MASDAGRTVVLFDYWRSSASYRVRIALGLLGIEYEARPVNLLKGGHRAPDYLKMNPQGLVPALLIDGRVMTQSLAIIEYLHATTDGSSLLPNGEIGKQKVRQLSYAIAMEIHPICNLSVATYAAEQCGGGDDAKRMWMRHFIGSGLANFEAMLADAGDGPFSTGDRPTLADCCLIPQLYNAERWGVDYASHARICRVRDAAADIDAFRAAHPDAVGPPEE